jgi:tetratricopeptide (TPR) repeat protein
MSVCEICGKTFDRQFGGGMLTGDGTVFKCSDCAAKGLDSTPRAEGNTAEFARELKQLAPARPVTTWALVAACLAVYTLELATGAGFDSMTPALAIQLGANYGPLTLAGQWWRLLTAMFLHFGVIHLALNMWCVWTLGALAEQLMGHAAFLELYFATGLAGGLLGLAVHPNVVSAGASGAVFGISGGLVTYLWLKKAPIDFAKVKKQLSSLGAFLAYNLFYSLQPGIDLMAHVGGLFAGLAIGVALPRFLEPADAAAIPSLIREHGLRRIRLAGVGIACVAVLLAGAAAIRLHPNDATAHNNSGAALAENGETDAAIIEFRAALKLNPNYAEAHYDLGVVLSQRGDLDGAIAEFRAAVKIKPNNAVAHYNLGVALANKGELDGAIGAFRAAVKINPNYAEAHNNLGVVLSQTGDLDAAVEEFRAALKINPNYAQAHNNLRSVLASKSDLDGAISEFRAALKINPNDADAHFNLGLAFENKGDLNAALGEFRRALELDPHFDAAKAGSERVSNKLQKK